MRKQYILYIIVILSSLISIINTDNTSALSYQSNVDVGFTFLPTLNVSLSSDNLTINNLVPGGNAIDSNTITINVSTNIAEGYNLYATVGSDSSSGNNNANANINVNNGYNTANLVNTVDNNYTFTPLSSNVSELANFTNNTWGYSYSLDSGTTWVSGDYDNASTGYNGLPLYTNTGTKLVEEVDNTSSTVDFKIAAKAGNTQPSGEYTNTINFTVVSNTIPTTMLDAFIASGAQMYNGYFKMQDMTPTICSSIDTDGEKGMQLIDVRDDKVYWVAKLKDNNCWMTQNLDLDLSHEVALTSETSDIDPESYGKTIYTAETGYTKDETTGVVSWLPSAIDENGIQRADTIDMVWNGNNATAPGGINGYDKPYSANPGDRYMYTSSSTYEKTMYTSLKSCSNDNGGDYIGCQHTHFGNYYHWPAAIASNNATNASGSQTNSICPKNWNLPAKESYSTLMQKQNIWDNNGDAYINNGFNLLRTNPLYFQQFGYIDNRSLHGLGDSGFYWSSVKYVGNNAYVLRFTESYIQPKGHWCTGFSIRCFTN